MMSKRPWTKPQITQVKLDLDLAASDRIRTEERVLELTSGGGQEREDEDWRRRLNLRDRCA
jgi:hypothetical protein